MALKNRDPATRRSFVPRSFEALEPRTLLNATLTSPLPSVSAAQNSPATTIDLSAHFNDPTVVGTAVVMHTTQGDIPLTLTDSQTPLTVANFLNYTNTGAYNGTVIQRVVVDPSLSIMQGGQYLPDGSTIPAGNPIPSEAGIPNTAGTIAMALNPNGPGTATDAWFINLANNPVLNGASDGGPFAVFGRIIYGGQNVVTQIANLPKGNGPFQPIQGDPASGTVPLQNYAGGTPTTANFVTIPSVQVVPKLAYTITNDNPAIVTPTLSNGTLSLNYVPNESGVANLTVKATDLGGNVVSSTFQVSLGSVIGAGGARSLRFTDADGTASTLSLTGPGSATVQFSGTGVTQTTSKAKVLTVSGTDLHILSIALTGTSAASTLNVSGAGGNGLVEIASITTDGDLRAINAARGSLLGNLTAVGSIGRILLANASTGAITVNGTSGALSMTVGTAGSEFINSAEPIALLQARTWVIASNAQNITTPGTIAAPSVGRVLVNGEFHANLTAGSLGPVTAGSITPGTWNITGAATSITAGSITGLALSAASVGRVTSRGAISGSQVASSGDVTSVAAASLSGSQILAGNPPLGAGSVPTASPTAATIGAVTVGRGGFGSSVIGASSLGRLSLGAVTSTNGGTPFGVAAHQIVSLIAVVDGKRLFLRNVTTAAQVTTALASAGITPNDLLIRIV